MSLNWELEFYGSNPANPVSIDLFSQVKVCFIYVWCTKKMYYKATIQVSCGTLQHIFFLFGIPNGYNVFSSK